MAAKATAKGMDNNRTIYKTCEFCYKQATDIISLSPEQMIIIIFKKHFKKRKKELINSFIYYLSNYLFCPGGADPAGFWFSVSCVNPEPLHDGCCPPG